MALFDNIDKLINEHGSSTILRERLLLASDKYSLLENEKLKLLEKIKILEAHSQTLKLDLEQAKVQIRDLDKQLSHSHNVNPDGYVCDHCGSSNLKRTGSRSDPTFGDLGVKQKLFICNKCGKESAFTPEP